MDSQSATTTINPSFMDTLPEILFSQGTDQAQSKRVRRLAANGHLRKLHAGVYTSTGTSPLVKLYSYSSTMRRCK
jgi:hypothetical protein